MITVLIQLFVAIIFGVILGKASITTTIIVGIGLIIITAINCDIVMSDSEIKGEIL